MKTHISRGTLIRLLTCGFLLTGAISAQAEMTVVDEGQAALKGTIIPIPPKEIWKVNAGDRISVVMSSWCKANGWSLIWNAPEIVSEVDVAVEGKFEGVIEMILDALNRSGAGVHAVFYDANHILRVTEKKQ